MAVVQGKNRLHVPRSGETQNVIPMHDGIV